MSFGLSSKGWLVQEHKMSWASWMGQETKNHFVAATGEFVGTVLFLFFAFAGTQVANIPVPQATGAVVTQSGSNPPLLLYISLAFGFSLAVNAWVFYRISGGLFNPAVTFAMVLAGAMPMVRGVCIFVSQMLGGITAAAIVSVLFPGDLNVTTSLGGGCSVVRGLFIEMFLTAQLVFTIFMLANEKSRATFIAPIGIGLSLFIAELAGVYYTGGSLNPARSFGPAVVLHRFHGYHWIYWVGPGLGSVVATGFYKFIKILEYESANPDQDIDLNTRPQEQHHEEERRHHLHLHHHAQEHEGQTQSGTQSSKWSKSKESDLEAQNGVGSL